MVNVANPSMVENRTRWGFRDLTALAVLGIAVASPVQAKTFVCGAGDVPCLIAAINEANANGNKNTIRLAAGSYTLTAIDNETDGANGLPSVTSSLTIRGNRADTTVIERDDSAPTFRLLHVAALGALTLDALALEGGSATGPTPDFPGKGGAIFNAGTLTVLHSHLTKNAATGPSPFTGSNVAPGDGGAIYSIGALRVGHSVVGSNTATGGNFSDAHGGGIFSSGTLTVTNSALSGNTAVGGGPQNSGLGGGIFTSGGATVTDTTVSGNTAMKNPSAGRGGGAGGGVYSSGSLTITHSTLTGNTAEASQRDTSVGGALLSSGPLTVVNSTVSGNAAGNAGGGIYSTGPMSVTHTFVTDNTLVGFNLVGGAADGGGVYCLGGTIVSSTLARNGIAEDSQLGVHGGGMFCGGTLVGCSVIDSTISGNTVTGGTLPTPGYGGGISAEGMLTVINSTVSGNTVNGDSSSSGGGMFFRIGSLSLIVNSTLSGNLANHGGGIANGTTIGTLALLNAIVAGNNPTAVAPDCVGPVTSLGNNLIGNTTGCTITLLASDRTGDPGLAPFTDNSTPGNGHFPLLPNSQAIDAGTDALCPSTDQLGHRRQGACDIGSIEFRQPKERRHDDVQD